MCRRDDKNETLGGGRSVGSCPISNTWGMDALLLLVAKAGQIVSQRDLTDAVRTDFDVTDNAICQAVSDLKAGARPSGRWRAVSQVRRCCWPQWPPSPRSSRPAARRAWLRWPRCAVINR